MKLSKLPWFVVITIAIIPFTYFLLRLLGIPILVFIPNSQDQSFLDGAMGNWFATIVGLIAGIPIALWINQKQQKLQEQERIISEEKTRNLRKNNVLALLRNELNTNEKNLTYLLEKQKDTPRIVILGGMKNVLWKAFSDSGELQWIDNPVLIDEISNAYHNINVLAELESRYSDPYFSSSVSDRSGRNTYAGESTVKNVQILRPKALETVNKAINSIDVELQL